MDIRIPRYTLLNNRFVLNRRMGRGAFSQIYTAFDIRHDKEVVLLKFIIGDGGDPAYNNEVAFLNACQGTQGYPTRGFPYKIANFAFVLHQAIYRCIALTYEGFALNKIEREKGLLQPSNVLKIGYRMYLLFDHMHEMGFVHRDFHAGNVTIDNNWRGEMQVSLIDFGSSRRSMPPPPCQPNDAWTSSLSCSLGHVHTHHDDLISMVFTLMDSMNVRPFTNRQTVVADKRAFHADPMAHFPIQNTEWLGEFYMHIEGRRGQEIERDQILDIFRKAMKNDPEDTFINPADPITFSYTDGLFLVD